MPSTTSQDQPFRRFDLTSVLFAGALGALVVLGGCASGASTAGTGGKPGSGGNKASGGTSGTGGATAGTGGAISGSGGNASTGGATASSGGSSGSGGNASGGATGGAPSGANTGGVDGGASSGGVGGATSSGGDTGSGGAETGGTGTGGSATGGAGGMGFALRCGVVNAPNNTVVAQSAVITDFTYTDGTNGVTATSFSFGDFTDTASGYGFHYPEQTAAGGAGGSASGGAGGRGGAGGNGSGGAGLGPTGLKENLTNSDWHITGVVGTYSAFVVSFACATDASAFSGIEFTIKGSAGSPNRLTLQAAFAGDETGTTDVNNPGLGTCTGSCTAPSATVNLTSTATTVRLPWSAFTGGKPLNSVNPAQLVALRWVFAWSGASNATPYSVDVTLDNLHFMTSAPADAGTAD